MLTPDTRSERPTFEESRRIWDAPIFSAVGDREAEPEEFLAAVRKLYEGGGAEFARFSMADDPRLEWFVWANRLGEIDFLDNLLTSPALREAMPAIAHETISRPISWEWTSPYVLDGEFAHLLKFGGAYEAFEGSGSEAKAIGRRACERLFDERYEEILLFKTHTPWSDWFFDIAWDTTWVGVDKGRREAWLLCVTDTD